MSSDCAVVLCTLLTVGFGAFPSAAAGDAGPGEAMAGVALAARADEQLAEAERASHRAAAHVWEGFLDAGLVAGGAQGAYGPWTAALEAAEDWAGLMAAVARFRTAYPGHEPAAEILEREIKATLLAGELDRAHAAILSLEAARTPRLVLDRLTLATRLVVAQRYAEGRRLVQEALASPSVGSDDRVLLETALESWQSLGEELAPFSGKTLDGRRFDLGSLKGRVVLLDFWATWCPPCRESIPELVALYEDWAPRGLEIVGVNLDSEDESRQVKEFLRQRRATWRQLADDQGNTPISDRYGVKAIPTTFLLDASGRLVGIDLSGAELEAVLERLLGSPAVRVEQGAQR